MADWALPHSQGLEKLAAANEAASRGSVGLQYQTSLLTYTLQELVASTARDYSGLYFMGCHQETAASSTPNQVYWIDIFLGGAGSEYNFGYTFNWYGRSGRLGDNGVFIPQFIPAGTRITLRARGEGAKTTGGNYVDLYGVRRGWHGHRGFQRYFDLGTDSNYISLAGPGGPQTQRHLMGALTDPPTFSTTADVEWSASSWYTICDHCPADVGYVIPRAWPSTSSNTHEDNPSFANTGRYYAFQLGIGPDGSEEIIGQTFFQMWTTASSWGGQAPHTFPGFYCYIPRGSRVVARPVSSQTDSFDGYQSILLHCWG